VLKGISGSLGSRNSDEGGREEDQGCDNMTSGDAAAIKEAGRGRLGWPRYVE